MALTGKDVKNLMEVGRMKYVFGCGCSQCVALREAGAEAEEIVPGEPMLTIDMRGWMKENPCPPRTFRDYLTEMQEIHDAKAADYAPGEDRFKNFRQCEAMGISAFDGCLVRMSDKFSRLLNLSKKAKQGEGASVKDESVRDTLLDLAIYAVIAIQLYEEK